MERIQETNFVHDIYHSWDEMIDACRNNRDYPVDSVQKHHNAVKSSSRPWNGNLTHLQTCNMAEFGWPDGREFMQDINYDIDPMAREFVVENETVLYDVAGQVPDVPRAIAGDPCCFVTTETTEASSKIVKLVIDVVGPSTIRPKTFKLHGGAVISWVDYLESKGWCCEIVVRFSASRGDFVGVIDVVAKQAGEPFDLDRMLFAVAHPSSLRRLFFHLQDLQPGTAVLTHTRGAPAKYGENGAIYVPSLDENLDDADAAINNLTPIMENSGAAA